MKFTNLAHVAFQVRDLDRSLAFYRDGLGLAEHFRIPLRKLGDLLDEAAASGNQQGTEEEMAYIAEHPDDPWLVYLHIAPLQFLELFPAMIPTDVLDPVAADFYAHFCLQVQDIEQAWAEASERGLEPGPISSGSDMSVQFWLADPDGRRIEIMQYSAESFQLRPPHPSIGD